MKQGRRLLFTPGPTEVPLHVLRAMSRPILNPDIEEDFFSIYDSLCSKIQKVCGTRSDLFVMAGEGMVALDMAVANLVEKGDRVLTISSGIFGDGLRDLVRNYGGIPVEASAEYNDVVPPSTIERELEKNRDIRVATFVHCETPAGTIAPLEEVGKICSDNGVILIADTVSTLGGVPVNADRNHVDVCLGASQKCFSAPPGLAIITASGRAWEKIESRRENVPSFYLSLTEWKKWWLERRIFPYTQSVSDIFALDRALDMILEEGLTSVYRRHAEVARIVREGCREIGLELYPKDEAISSNTVTALLLPASISEQRLRERMERKHGIIIAGSWGRLSGKVVRLGHMGYNAQSAKARRVLNALSESVKKLNS